MIRKISFAMLGFVAIAAAETAHAAPASEDPGQAWITRVEDPASPPAQPSTRVFEGNPAQDFIARLQNPASPPAQPSSSTFKRDPAQEFVARLSTVSLSYTPHPANS